MSKEEEEVYNLVSFHTRPLDEDGELEKYLDLNGKAYLIIIPELREVDEEKTVPVDFSAQIWAKGITPVFMEMLLKMAVSTFTSAVEDPNVCPIHWSHDNEEAEEH